MISYDSLTDFDFQILDAVYQHHSITVSQLQALFPNQRALQLRLRLLATPDIEIYDHGFSAPVENTAYLELDCSEIGMPYGDLEKSVKAIQITALGIKTVEEHALHQQQIRKRLWEERIWKLTPICISILALIVATISLLEALHWIHLEQ